MDKEELESVIDELKILAKDQLESIRDREKQLYRYNVVDDEIDYDKGYYNGIVYTLSLLGNTELDYID